MGEGHDHSSQKNATVILSYFVLCHPKRLVRYSLAQMIYVTQQATSSPHFILILFFLTTHRHTEQLRNTDCTQYLTLVPTFSVNSNHNQRLQTPENGISILNQRNQRASQQLDATVRLIYQFSSLSEYATCLYSSRDQSITNASNLADSTTWTTSTRTYPPSTTS